MDMDNIFFEENTEVRMSEITKMYLGGYKVDLDALNIDKLLVALEETINGHLGNII